MHVSHTALTSSHRNKRTRALRYESARAVTELNRKAKMYVPLFDKPDNRKCAATERHIHRHAMAATNIRESKKESALT